VFHGVEQFGFGGFGLREIFFGGIVDAEILEAVAGLVEGLAVEVEPFCFEAPANEGDVGWEVAGFVMELREGEAQILEAVAGEAFDEGARCGFGVAPPGMIAGDLPIGLPFGASG